MKIVTNQKKKCWVFTWIKAIYYGENGKKYEIDQITMKNFDLIKKKTVFITNLQFLFNFLISFYDRETSFDKYYMLARAGTYRQ